MAASNQADSASGGVNLPTPRTAVAQEFEIYGADTTDEVDLLYEMGFTRVVLNFNADLIARAEELGLGIVVQNWWGVDTPWCQIRPVIDFAKTIQGLVSVNMMDEPILNGLAQYPPGYYVALREKIRDHGFDGPLSLTQYGPHLDWPVWWTRAFLDYFPAIDVLRIDPYPIVAGKKLRLVGLWTNTALQMLGATGRPFPLTVILEAWGLNNTLPSIQQIRVMAYIAMFSGAETVSFYQYDPTAWDEKFTDDFAALMQELTGLADEFDGAMVSSILGSDQLFQVEIEHNDQWTCITVNTSELPNAQFGPLQVVRETGRCPRPLLTIGPQFGLLRPHRKPTSGPTF